MGAPKGNEFWKKRSKHGRGPIFETPEIMLAACYEYFDYQSKQKWDKVDFRGKDIERVEIPVSSPFTMHGLCMFLGVNTTYFRQFKRKCSDEFSSVIAHVEEVVYLQKFEGATVGHYNPNIIARDLGLADKQVIEKEDGEPLAINFSVAEAVKEVKITKGKAKDA